MNGLQNQTQPAAFHNKNSDDPDTLGKQTVKYLMFLYCVPQHRDG